MVDRVRCQRRCFSLADHDQDHKESQVTMSSRRRFLVRAAASSGALACGRFPLRDGLRPVAANEVNLDPNCVRFQLETKPLVRQLEDTSRERLLEEIAVQIARV